MNDVMKHLADSNVKRNLSMMSNVKQTARDILLRMGFEETDTPVLMPVTGESYNATFDIMLENDKAMLADSPQIYKMLLSRAGYEKYFQFAHCFRKITNENDLNTRLNEFVQLDLELRDTELNELIKTAELLISEICGALHKKAKTSCIQGIECRSRYGDEMKPDLRGDNDEISLVIIKNMPLTNDGKIPCHHIFANPTESDRLDPTNDLTELTTESFDIIMNGIEIGGGDMRISDRELQTRVMRLFNVDEKRYAGYLGILEECDRCNSGGFALGLERMVMALSGAKSIRQTTAFPDYYKRGAN